MNWLAHVFLAGPDADCRLGNLLADMLKGPARRRLRPGLLRGIACHQAVDAFTDYHPIFHRSKRRLGPDYERFAGILVDVFYDHILATSWPHYADRSLGDFTGEIYASFPAYQAELPGEVNAVLSRLAAEDWFGSYATLAGIEEVLARISRRLSRRLNRAIAFEHAIATLTANREPLAADFHEFFPQLAAYVHSWQAA
jgi:acyl carrier protein phosphodiesterase